MDDFYAAIANLMVDLKSCVALTGAGISAESGIPTADIVVKEKAGVGLSNILEAVRRTYAQGQPRDA